MAIISPLFHGRGNDNPDLPPGQFLVKDWPVLTYGPTPDTKKEDWTLKLSGLVAKEVSLGWDEFMKLPNDTWTTDIHCVTRWSKLGTNWRGVWFSELLRLAGGAKPAATHILIACYGGYTTNLALGEVTGKQAMVAFEFDGAPLPREHGGLARFLVPHLYFWKSAKWIREIRLLDHDELGFWEQNGYHTHGDPWKEERYSGD